jgi:hypothetical protein
MIVYRVYNEQGGYVEYTEEPQGVEFEIIDKTPTPEEIAELQAQTLKARETEMYLKRAGDGIKAYAEISAEFRLAKLAGVISEEQHGAIEETLIPVRNEVLAGQWMSALQKLEAIGVAIGSELYDRLHTQISNYIAENYDLPN